MVLETSRLGTGSTLMVQGTTSDAGKSTLVAALCRLYYRQGVSVAPFKPQNMALNSAVTVDGGEIGRAQALQARAAGLEPVVDMNPVLLKPTTDKGAQVIIHGQARFQMNAVQYHEYKQQAMGAVLESHQRLQKQYARIIVEGAGSPAEINLREHDIANMGFAEKVDCPVILVADINRGGVFAHIVGTLALLSDSERARIKGVVINRFRGDIALLKPGLDWLEDDIGKPVLGVLPYLQGLHLDGEDGINPVNDNIAGNSVNHNGDTKKINVVVPVLPRISNHTDLDPLRLHPQVAFSYVKANQNIPPADLIILPGSKNTLMDLRWLKQQGWQQAIQRHLRYGGKVLGICGGFQMLGTMLRDEDGIEGKPGSEPGLGFLDMETRLMPEKQLHRREGYILPFQSACSGYEIHCGISTGPALEQPMIEFSCGLDKSVKEGAVSVDGNVMGTYLHGILDASASLAAILKWAGVSGEIEAVDYDELRNQNLDRLADATAEHLDLKKIERLFQ